MANLKDYVHRKVVFKPQFEGKNIKFRPTLDNNVYVDALIKMILNDLVTIVYVENYEIKERTFRVDECYDYFKFNDYSERQAEIVYSTDFNPSDAVFIKNKNTKALFRNLSGDEIRFYYVDKDGDVSYFNVRINDIISNKVTGEVWEYER